MSTMLETTRSMPNRRASTRLSTYSVTPTLTPSVAPSRLSAAPSDPKQSLDIENYSYTPEANRLGNRASYIAPARFSTISRSDVDDHSLKNVETHLKRMEDARLQTQRFVVSESKRDELAYLSLGAKLEKALGRRMSGQDAVFTPKKKKHIPIVPVISEKK